MEYDAKYFADLFVEVAKRESSRRSFKHGISTGSGHIPFDTGATQKSVYVSRVAPDTATVTMGNDEAFYVVYLQYANNVGNTTVINQHRGFVQKFARGEFVAELRRLFGNIEVT